VTAAVFGLIGVVVGAVINGAVTAMVQRRAERSDRQSAARLVSTELARFRSIALEAARRSPEQLPQLRESTPILWQSQRAVLARGLDDADWEAVARAYAHVDALGSVLVFEPDGTLEDWRSREAQRLLQAMVQPVEQAFLALGRASGVPSELLDIPESGPVAV
jgi:hypothetical protein